MGALTGPHPVDYKMEGNGSIVNNSATLAIHPKSAVLLVLIAMISAIIVGVVSSFYMNALVAATVGEIACYLAPTLIVVLVRPERRATLFKLDRLRDWRLVLLIPAAAVMLNFSCSVFDDFTNSIFPIPESFVSYIFKLLSADSPVGLVYVILAAAVLPAIAEEMLFRGVLLSSLIAKYDVWTGIVLSSLLFAFVHLNPWSFVSIFAIGTFFGYVTYKTGTFWAGSLGHLATNIAGVVVVNTKESTDYMSIVSGCDWYVVIAMTVGSVAGLAAIARICRNKKCAVEQSPQNAQGS